MLLLSSLTKDFGLYIEDRAILEVDQPGLLGSGNLSREHTMHDSMV